MDRRKRLQLTPAREGLALPTIMNSALAARYGVSYVRLAALAIDLDRAYTLVADDAQLPFGWEVFVTECYLLAAVDAQDEPARALLEETCLSILEQPPDEQGYGSQLLFAVFDAVQRGFYPSSAAAPFRSWRSPPKQLHKALSALWAAPGESLGALAAHVLALPLDPPLAPPSRAKLEQMRDGRRPLPASAG
jgi:hypothetical protein